MLQKEKTQWKPILLTALVTGAALLVAYALLGIYPLGDRSVITGDLNSQYIPYFAHYRDVLWGAGGSGFTFEKSLGGSLAGIFAYYCSSLFNWIYLLVPVTWYAQAACLVLWVKLVLAAGCFAYFLQKHDAKIPQWAQVALGAGYGLCAYNLAYSQNIMWHDVMLLLPLLCAGLDKLVRQGRPVQYAVVLLLMIYSNFYIGYMACIFAVLYFFWLLCVETPQRKGRALGQFTLASLAGGLVNGWLLMPVIIDLNQNKGELLQFSFSWKPKFALQMLPQQLFPGTFLWKDVEAGLPNLYCGLLAVILVSAFFLCGKQITKKVKLASGGILLILLTSFWIEGFDTFWHGMKAPVWFPYRYSFLFSFWILFLAAYAAAYVRWDKMLTIKVSALCGTLFALSVLFRKPGVGLRYLAITAIAGLVLAAVWFCVQKKKCTAWLLTALCAVELAANTAFVLNPFEPYSVRDYRTFVADGKAAVQAVQAKDPDFYRMEKTGIRTLNDPMLLGYWGVSHFGSTQDNSSVDLLVRLGYGNYASCNTYYHGSTPVADSLLGIRYIFQQPGGFEPPYGYTPLDVESPWQVYENPYALPLAVVADDALTQLPLENGEDLFLWQQRVLASLAKEPDLQVYTATETEKQTERQLTITTKQDGPCYAFILTAGESGVVVNGEKKGRVQTLDRGGMIFLGEQKAGQVLNVETEQDILAAFCYTLDESELLRVSDTIRSNAPQIREMSDTHIAVTAQADENQLLWIPVGYADGWQITVNGSPVEPVTLASVCLGVPLTAGENTVELVWKTPGTGVGLCVTAAGVLLLMIVIYWQYKKH